MRSKDSAATALRVLVLGGTGEGRTLAEAMGDRSDVDVTLALAGATRQPRVAGSVVRVGGFGGVEGLTAYLVTHGTQALVDATHPCAAAMPSNAAAAARQAHVPRLRVLRDHWVSGPGDCWHAATDVASAAAITCKLGQHPLVALGARGASRFATDGFASVYVRAIEEPADLPANARWIAARPPFSLADESALMERLGVDVLVTRNAGGPATGAKLHAARTLGLPVVMIERPPVPEGPVVATVPEAIAWLDQLLGSRHT